MATSAASADDAARCRPEQRRREREARGDHGPNVSRRTRRRSEADDLGRDLPPCALAISIPPSSTRTPSPSARCARSISVVPVWSGYRAGELGERDPQDADGAVARDVRVSRRRRPGRSLRGRRPGRRERSIRRGRGTQASSACQTTSTVSGLRCGKRSLRSCAAAQRLRAGRRVVGGPVAGPGPALTANAATRATTQVATTTQTAPEGQIGQARQAAAGSGRSGHWGGPPRGVAVAAGNVGESRLRLERLTRQP